LKLGATTAIGLVVFFLLPAGHVSAQDDEEIEPVYATSKILNQRGPKLGRFGLQPMLKLLYPGLRKFAHASKLPDEDEDPEVIDQVLGTRGRFLIKTEKGIVATPNAIALLIIHTYTSEDNLSRTAELAVLTIQDRKLKVIVRQRMEDWVSDFEPVSGIGSSLDLKLYRLHPKASALGLIIKQVSQDQTTIEENTEVVLFLIEEDSFSEIFQHSLRSSMTEFVHTKPKSVSVSSSDTNIIISAKQSQGLYGLDVEVHQAESFNGRVFHTEMNLELYRWEDDGYQDYSP
jgi:hypothetical protein